MIFVLLYFVSDTLKAQKVFLFYFFWKKLKQFANMLFYFEKYSLSIG